MGWYDYLKTNGFFDPSANPKPVKVKHGYSHPRWEALDYLEMVADKIKNGEAKEYIDELIGVVQEVSESPVDNYLSWYRLISILTRLPNDRIPLSILAYQPVWVNSSFNTGLQTAGIAETMLPKFLSENVADQEKAGLIFNNLFVLHLAESSSQKDSRNLYSPYDLGNLSQALVEMKVIEQVQKYLGANALLHIADQLNALLRDHRRYFDLRKDEHIFQLSIVPHLNELQITLTGHDMAQIDHKIIVDYYNNATDWSRAFFTKYLQDADLTGTDANLIIDQIEFTLQNDLESLMSFYSISDLEEEAESGYAELHTFAFILTSGLKALAANPKIEDVAVLTQLLSANRYQLPFFKRILLHIISLNWPVLKNLFWEMSGENDQHHVFSNYLFHKELYQLLEKVAGDLDAEDISKLTGILAQGPLGDRHNHQSPEEWRNRWLHALQQNPAFTEIFNSVSTPGQVKKDYASEGKIMVRVGSTSSHTAEELIQLSDDELVHLLFTFRDRDRFEEPTVEGLGQRLQEAIKEHPEHFVPKLAKLTEVNYSYAYRIFWGFQEALKVNHLFNWKPVLQFIGDYITQAAFLDDKLIAPDDLRTSRDLVAGQIAYLFSEGSRHETGGFDAEDILTATGIIIRLSEQLKPSERVPKEPTHDFVMSSLNTTQGKVLRAIIDCALMIARGTEAPVSADNWHPGLKSAYEQNMYPQILDGYTLQGMYLSQFMFLDDQWLRSNVLKHQQLPLLPWSAFMSGVAFGKPISGDYYPLMHPHYQRALEENRIDLHYQQGLLRHFVAFFFWDYETIYEQTFIYKLINRYPSQYTHALIQFIITQLPSIISLEDDVERIKLTQKVIRIWEHLLQLFAGAITDEDREPLKGIIRFITVLKKLDRRSTDLIKATLPVDPTHGRGDFIIKQLIRLNNLPGSSALIAEIAQAIDLNSFYNSEQLKTLIIMLYDNQQKEAANTIVNNLVILGNNHFKQIYIDQNPQ